MDSNEKLQPTVFAIFGGSGDLTWRKLVPSLYDLFQDVTMPKHFSIIALDRIELNDEELRLRFRDGIEKFSRKGKVNDKTWQQFAKHIYYQKGDFTKNATIGKAKSNTIEATKSNTRLFLCWANSASAYRWPMVYSSPAA